MGIDQVLKMNEGLDVHNMGPNKLSDGINHQGQKSGVIYLRNFAQGEGNSLETVTRVTNIKPSGFSQI